MSDEFSFERIG